MSREALFKEFSSYARDKIYDRYPDAQAPLDSSWVFVGKNKTEITFETVSELAKGILESNR